MGKPASLLPTLFLDRDGTLMQEVEYPKYPRQVKLLPGVPAGLRRLKRAGFPVVIVSNQSGVGRGIISEHQLKAVWARFFLYLARQKAYVDGYYWCPHTAEARCQCRKPGSKLLRQAAKELKLAWRHSISVGDRPSDVQLSQRVGGQGVLVLTGYGRKNLKVWPGRKPDYVAKNFKAVVDWLLSRVRKDGTWISQN